MIKNDATSEHAMSESEARDLTARIKRGLSETWKLVAWAYVKRAWVSLSYASWDDYVVKEFGTTALFVPRADRSVMVQSMSQLGMSNRAIADACGFSERTVRRDLSGVEVRHDAAPDVRELAQQLKINIDQPTTLGKDGKRYAVPEPTPTDDHPTGPKSTVATNDSLMQARLVLGEVRRTVSKLAGYTAHDHIRDGLSADDKAKMDTEIEEAIKGLRQCQKDLKDPAGKGAEMVAVA